MRGESGIRLSCTALKFAVGIKTNLRSIPKPLPFRFEESERVARWKKSIGIDGFKIGVSWQGAYSEIDAGRSFSVKHFEGISSLSGVRLISLQKGPAVAQFADACSVLKVETLGDSFDSGPDAFMDTAAVMQVCDLVITSDTAIAHLAGSLGVPVWVVLKYVPDWRWLLDRPDSPWYPTMRLFRQPVAGDWNGTFAEVATEVSRAIEGRNDCSLDRGKSLST